jgi:hypothetical protein
MEDAYARSITEVTNLVLSILLRYNIGLTMEGIKL